MASRALVVMLFSVLATGCGAHGSSGHSASAKTPLPAPVTVGPGKLVGIGGGRSLFLYCVGSGSPTVVLEAGLGGDHGNWRDVQPGLGRTTRTCSYDRAGVGNSVAPPGVRDAGDELGDLQRLLDHARVAPPYVLVGHSYGGLLARLFARARPRETAGIVLVDSMVRNQTRRQLAIWPKSEARALRRQVATPVRDAVNLAAGEALAARVTSLDDKPLAVVTAGTHSAEWGRVPRRLARALDRQWATAQDELATLSSDHLHVVALHSDHSIQVRRLYIGNKRVEGQPDVVVQAVNAVVRAARERTRLPPCAEVFGGPDVRCRG